MEAAEQQVPHGPQEHEEAVRVSGCHRSVRSAGAGGSDGKQTLSQVMLADHERGNACKMVLLATPACMGQQPTALCQGVRSWGDLVLHMLTRVCAGWPLICRSVPSPVPGFWC